MLAYGIKFSPEADEQLAALAAHHRAMLLDGVEWQLSQQPTVETRNRKRMREGERVPVAPWELRMGPLRVYYDVEESPERLVMVVAIGVKVRNRVRIGEKEIEP